MGLSISWTEENFPQEKLLILKEMREWYRNMLNTLVGIVISRMLCTIRLVIVLSSVTFYLLHFVLCVQITIPIKEACLLYRREGQIQRASVPSNFLYTVESQCVQVKICFFLVLSEQVSSAPRNVIISSRAHHMLLSPVTFPSSITGNSVPPITLIFFYFRLLYFCIGHL